MVPKSVTFVGAPAKDLLKEALQTGHHDHGARQEMRSKSPPAKRCRRKGPDAPFYTRIQVYIPWESRPT